MAGLNKIAFFVPTKRPGMLVGPCDPERLENLIAVVKQAKAEGKGVVFFLWQNDGSRGGKSVASLTVAVQQDRPEGVRARSIGGRPAPTQTAAPRNAALDGLFAKPAEAAAPKEEAW